MKVRYLTAGESHGRALVGILDGVPAGLEIDSDYINRELSRRQVGYGRGRRMKIEKDRVEILAGIRHGRTLGTPICLLIENKDWPNWERIMSAERVDPGIDDSRDKVTVPRPGHADLAGVWKYGTDDIRDIIERSSARSTAMTVALGSVARSFLELFNVHVAGHVTAIGGVSAAVSPELDPVGIRKITERSDLLCLDSSAAEKMRRAIDDARSKGDTVGGCFQVIATGVLPGLGSFAQPERRLDGRIAQAVMAIPAIKAVAIGDGFKAGSTSGSEFHDPIYLDGEKVRRSSNRAGGIEGGISNGEPIVVNAVMKPIPTLARPLDSIDIITGEPTPAHKERSDTCAVPAAAVVAESALCLVLMEAYLEKFGGDSINEVKDNASRFRDRVEGQIPRHR